MDLALNAAEFNQEKDERLDVLSIGVGQEEHQFLFDYVRFLVGQHLVDVDYADYLIEWDEFELQPKFVAPLTSRGRELVGLISEEEQHFVSAGELNEEGELRVAQEGMFEMMPISYVRRMLRVADFQEKVRARLSSKAGKPE